MKSLASNAAVIPKGRKNNNNILNPEESGLLVTSKPIQSLPIIALYYLHHDIITFRPTFTNTHNNSLQNEDMSIHTPYRIPAILCNRASKKVSFAVNLTEVREISYRYPKDFFYSREDTAR